MVSLVLHSIKGLVICVVRLVIWYIMFKCSPILSLSGFRNANKLPISFFLQLNVFSGVHMIVSFPGVFVKLLQQRQILCS